MRTGMTAPKSAPLPSAFSNASRRCAVLAAASLLALTFNCAVAAAASGSNTNTESSSGQAALLGLGSFQARQDYLPHFPKLKLPNKWRVLLSLLTRVGKLCGKPAAAPIVNNAAAYSSGRGRTGEASSSGESVRGSSSSSRKAEIERRTLAEAVPLSKPTRGPSNGARIPVIETTGLKDSNKDVKPKQRAIESPYTSALELTDAVSPARQKIESWTPRKNRYLVALCVLGRLSNQQRCLRNYLIAAALLQRTLVIPNEGCGVTVYRTLCWRWDNIVDVTRTRACLAPAYGTNETVITVDEYVAREGRDVAIDHIACVMSRSCLDKWHMIKEHFPHITLPNNLEYPSIPTKHVTDFLRAYAPYNDAPVISLGDAFHFVLRGPPFYFEGAVPPFTSTCADIWQPPLVIDNFVNGFVGTFLGSEYAAVHLRRGDFAGRFQNKSSETDRATFLPVVTVARFISERLRDTGVSVVYLATDASPSEIQLLEKLFLGAGSTNPLVVVRLPEFAKESEEYSQFRWVKKFQDLDSEGNGSLRALAEKHICANARFFIGTQMSTFSLDIRRLRLLHERMSEVDAYFSDSNA